MRIQTQPGWANNLRQGAPKLWREERIRGYVCGLCITLMTYLFLLLILLLLLLLLLLLPLLLLLLSFYKGLPPLWLRQIPYTMMKFAAFERTIEFFYKYVIPVPR